MLKFICLSLCPSVRHTSSCFFQKTALRNKILSPQEADWPGDSEREAAQQRGKRMTNKKPLPIRVMSANQIQAFVGEAAAPGEGEPGGGLQGQLPDPPGRYRGV